MELNKDNFDANLISIKSEIEKSSFIGYDAEFTGIPSENCFKHRLFDTNEERYNKIKTEVSKMLITQIGLTLFKYERTSDSYIASSYTFHLSPQVFEDIDQAFTFQASTIKFLCKHNFDFNKFTYQGISYLSKAEEQHVRDLLKNGTLLENITRELSIEEETELQDKCSKVSKWLTKDEEDILFLDVSDPVMRYITHRELRNRFPGILTTDSLGKSNKLMIYKNKFIRGANNDSLEVLEGKLMQHLLGFSQVIKLLETYRKPIIGHNMFLDLITFHNQFIGPLPRSYATFKSNINDMLPNIYDTKYISHIMAKKLNFDEVWKSNALQNLYEFFAQGRCKKLEMNTNPIKLTTLFDVKQSYHEAGWDSYCSGYCFLRLGQWEACSGIGVRRPVAPTEMLTAMAPFCNKINVIRGAVPYMALIGKDPPNHRPPLLHIKALRDRVINIGKVASALAAYGSVDVKPHGSRAALVAAGSYHAADKILQQYEQSKEYKISKYSFYRHSASAQVALWCSTLVTGSMLVLYLRKKGYL